MPLNCRKWQKGSRVCKCTQTQKDYCGCWSSIEIPSVNEILTDAQKKDRQKYIDEIKKSIRSDEAALVLGAGISNPCKMPLWGPLISKMMGYAIQYDMIGKDHPRLHSKDTSEGRRLLKQSQNLICGELSLLGGVNALEAAEYVAQLFDIDADNNQWRQNLEEEAIGRMVHKIIGKSMKPEELLCAEDTGLPDVKQSIVNDGLSPAAAVKKAGHRKVASKNTMFAVSYLLASRGGIRRAMTYNYDPLVQEYMMSLFGTDKSRLLTHPGKWGEGVPGAADLCEIYHVHGFVAGQRHLNMCCKEIFPETSGPLILSEDSYYRIERSEAYNWSSSIQSHFLNRYRCVFVGFSAEDYNFRRILRQMGDMFTEKPPHYLIMTIDDWIINFYENVCQSCLEKSKKEKKKLTADKVDDIATDAILLLQYALECRAAYWERFNIRPVWVTVNETANLLAGLIDP